MWSFEDSELELGTAVKDSEILPQHLKKEITMGASFHTGTTHTLVPVWISLYSYCKGCVGALKTKSFKVMDKHICTHTTSIYLYIYIYMCVSSSSHMSHKSYMVNRNLLMLIVNGCGMVSKPSPMRHHLTWRLDSVECCYRNREYFFLEKCKWTTQQSCASGKIDPDMMFKGWIALQFFP